MHYHPLTKKEMEFKSADDLLYFLQRCNPTMMRLFKVQYESINKDYEIQGFGLEVKIIKKKK